MNHFWRRFGHWLNIFGFFLAGMALLASMNGQFSHMSPEDLWERGLGLVAVALGAATIVAIADTRLHPREVREAVTRITMRIRRRQDGHVRRALWR